MVKKSPSAYMVLNSSIKGDTHFLQKLSFLENQGLELLILKNNARLKLHQDLEILCI